MLKSAPIFLLKKIQVNGHQIAKVIIGRHYLEKHSRSIDDGLIIDLVMVLDGGVFTADSVTGGIEYFATDIQFSKNQESKIYRLIWLFEGEFLEIIGIVNAYRVGKKKK